MITGLSVTVSVHTYQSKQTLTAENDALHLKCDALRNALSIYETRYRETNRLWDTIEAYEYFEQDTSTIDQELALHLPTLLEDPYSGVYKEDYFDTLLTGEKERYMYGIYISKQADGHILSLILDGSSAEESGLQSGDQILAYNHVPFSEWTNKELETFITDSHNVHLRILTSDGDSKEVVLEKRNIRRPSPYVKLLTKDIAYVNFKSFEDDTLMTLLPHLKTYSRQDIPYVILDLRDNGGGNMVYAHDLINFFSDSASPYIFIDNKDQTYRDNLPFAPNLSFNDFKTDFKLYILVNENTASAAEFLTTCLSEHENAIVIGDQTRGKGVMQNFFPIFDDYFVKLTTFEFYSAEGNEFHGVGLTPDIPVESRPWITPDVDEALEEAMRLIHDDKGRI